MMSVSNKAALEQWKLLYGDNDDGKPRRSTAGSNETAHNRDQGVKSVGKEPRDHTDKTVS